MLMWHLWARQRHLDWAQQWDNKEPQEKKKKGCKSNPFPQITYLIIQLPSCKNFLGLTAHCLPGKVQTLLNLWEIQTFHDNFSSTSCPHPTCTQWSSCPNSVLFSQISYTLHFPDLIPLSPLPKRLYHPNLHAPSKPASDVTSSKKPP